MHSFWKRSAVEWFMTFSTHSIDNDHEIDEHRKNWKKNQISVIAIMLINGAHCDENWRLGGMTPQKRIEKRGGEETDSLLVPTIMYTCLTATIICLLKHLLLFNRN